MMKGKADLSANSWGEVTIYEGRIIHPHNNVLINIVS